MQYIKLALPKKPSGIIIYSVNALEWVNRSHNYKINMREWYTPINGKCNVDLGGAIIAQSDNVSPLLILKPCNISPPYLKKIVKALNHLRLGLILNFCAELNPLLVSTIQETDPSIFTLNITPWEVSPIDFINNLLNLAKRLAYIKQ
jgi:hypothetical protein